MKDKKYENKNKYVSMMDLEMVKQICLSLKTSLKHHSHFLHKEVEDNICNYNKTMDLIP